MFRKSLLTILCLTFSIQGYGRDWPLRLKSPEWLERYWFTNGSHQSASLEQPVGIEIEGVYDEKKEGLFPSITEKTIEFLKSKGIEAQSSIIQGKFIEEVRITYLHKGQSYYLHIKPDHTIKQWNNKMAVEIASPILRNDHDIDLFIELILHLNKKVKFTAEPQHAGTHVHFSFPSPVPEDAVIFSTLFSAVEEELVEVFNVQESRREYAIPLSVVELDQILDFVGKHSEIVAYAFNYAFLMHHKNRSINWLAYRKFKTVEMRLLNSLTHPFALKVAVGFYKKLLRAVKTRDPQLFQYLSGKTPDQITLEGLAQAIGSELANKQVRDQIHKITRQDVEKEIRERAASHGSKLPSFDSLRRYSGSLTNNECLQHLSDIQPDE